MKLTLRLVSLLLVSVVLAGCSPQSRFMPSVTGKDQAEVSELMSKLGVEVEFLSEYSNEVPNGSAIGSYPDAGSDLDGIDSVTVTISDGVEPNWAPDGYTQIGDNIAFKWIEPWGDPCGGSECIFWRAEVVTNTGCPGGVYAEINLLSGNSVVDWTNETLSALSPDQIGELVFKIYGRGSTPGAIAELTDLSCY